MAHSRYTGPLPTIADGVQVYVCTPSAWVSMQEV